MHKTTGRFQKALILLPENVRKTANNNFELLKSNPKHPSLHFKKVGKFWSVRIGLNYRALATKDDIDYIWVWIGNHDEYLRLIKTK